MPSIDFSRIGPFFHNYMRMVGTEDLAEALRIHEEALSSFLTSLPAEKWDYRYAEGKWTIRELVQHIIDAERIFAYRALCIARNDQTAFPPFEENDYVVYSEANRRSAEELLAELLVVQRSTILLFRSFSEEQLERNGTVSGGVAYVRGLAFVTVGHALHHRQILEERYL
ncbi:MAG TPA: DinB family protein [Chitinophagaceae bacterium]|jgi:uncharacterized damage-inducible protein DinB|nr:DinB family protein [Chitinophagaceae bacterium]